ncbi:tyrosine-type recombinase/integrase [Salipiger abyssi]|uniref:tyrosine-type recombinase/integrase n=1 Tax=Salipiger abyssi TaxID=1250539 RepID=UPI0012EBF4DF|nr:tyrosine-type recombinase/integrase [Salipiger abyssi]
MKGLWIHPRSGLPYYRSRRGGKVKLVPLPAGLPHDHPDFITAWAEAARGEAKPIPKPKAGTIASTFRAALASDAFHRFSPGYRAIITRHAKAISDRGGDVKAAAVRAKHIRADMREAGDPGARLKAWRFWATYCIERDWLTDDPTTGIRKPVSEKTEGHRTWSRDEISAFRSAYAIGSTARAIMELAFWTGARVSDIVLIGPQHIDHQGVLAFRQTKTRDMAYVPWTCDLPAYAASMSPDRDLCRAAIEHLSGGLTFMQTGAGRPRSAKGASQSLSRACREIGLTGISIHGLRKARAVALAEAGGTGSQIGAWTGHRSLSEIAHYTREMDRRRAVIGTGTERERETNSESGFQKTKKL